MQNMTECRAADGAAVVGDSDLDRLTPSAPLSCEGVGENSPYCSGADCPRFAECKIYGFRLPRP